MSERYATPEEAREAGQGGWNIRCNRCGTYGALWYGERKGWGRLALCGKHRDEYDIAHAKARELISYATQVKYEQVDERRGPSSVPLGRGA